MGVIEESGMRIEYPDSNSFRIGELDAYKRLSGKHLKEMDLGYWDAEKETLWLVELKGESDRLLEVADEHHKETQTGDESIRLERCSRFTHDLMLKTLDTLLIMASIWSGTDEGLNIGEEIPEAIRQYPGHGNVKLAFVIDTAAERKHLLNILKDHVNTRLEGRLALFNIRRITLVDIDTASRLMSNATTGLRLSRATSV